jgi:hypothetical protein
MVGGDVFFANHSDELVSLAARHRVPAVYHRWEIAKAGGLMRATDQTLQMHGTLPATLLVAFSMEKPRPTSLSSDQKKSSFS